MIGLPDADEPRVSTLPSAAAGGGVPPKPRLATRPLFACCGPPAPPACDELPADNRSMLELEDDPDPGASSFDAVSRPPPALPMNMSFSTRAIWRASPY